MQRSLLMPASHVAVDVFVCILILALCVLQVALPVRTDDFFMGDTIYVELARSILETGTYGVDYHYVQYPPGLPALLALICATVGCSHAALVQSMAVVLALGMITSYWLLKREEGAGVAATTCLLLASSPIVFAFSTFGVSTDLPYLFTSMATLALAILLDQGGNTQRQTLLLSLTCTAMLVASLLIRSSGVALLAGLGGWLFVGGLWTDRPTRARRLRTFAGILLAGVVVQGTWMTWASRHETVEWPMLEGHPRSYLSQLIVKNGIHPELGTASVTEFALRLPRNVVDRATGLMQLLTRKDYLEATWYSPLVFGSVLLIALGLGTSIRSRGGTLSAWYFISHEAIYLIWPWPFEMRFLLPVAPLACLYLWRGGTALGEVVVRSPRKVGAGGVLIGLVVGAAAAIANSNSSSTQSKLAVACWAATVVVSVWLMLPNRSRAPSPSIRNLFRPRFTVPLWHSRVSLPRLVGAAAVGSLIALGVALQIGVGRENQKFDLTQHSAYGSVAAAHWIADHASETAVVMARQMDVVHHHAHRKVVWFPPISDPKVLMDGVRRLNADYIVVTNTWTYYQPPDAECIDALLKEFPQSFRIAKQEAPFRVIEVVNELAH